MQHIMLGSSAPRGVMPKSATCSAQRCSASLNTPQASRFRGRTAPFLQIRKRQGSKRNHQLQTSAVFDYCSTARGNAFTSSFRGSKALIMQLLRANVAPETRPEIFKALVCIAYLAEINTWVVLSVALPGMTSDPNIALPAAAVGGLLAIGTAGLTIGKFAAGVVLDKINPKWALIAVLLGAGGFNSLMAMGSTAMWFNVTWFMSRVIYASGWVAASRLICCWTPEETRGASLGSLAFAARIGFAVGASALGGLLLIGYSWRVLFHLTTGFAVVAAAMLAVAMPNEFPYDLSEGGGSSDYNLGVHPTKQLEVSQDDGRGKVLSTELGNRGGAEGGEGEGQSAAIAAGGATQATSMGGALKDFLTTPQVLMAIAARLSLHIMYEFTAFMNMWAVEVLKVSGGVAAQISAAFSGGSAVAVLAGGMLFCRFAGAGRRNMMVGLCICAGLSFFALTKVTSTLMVFVMVTLLGAGWSAPYYIPLPAYNLRKGGSYSAVLEGLCETVAYAGAMFFDIAMGKWLKGPNGYDKMFTVMIVCSISAVVFMSGFMQGEKRYEDNLINT